MAQKRKIEYEPEFLSQITINSGASLNKPLICSTEGGKTEWTTLGNSGIAGEAVTANKIGTGAIETSKYKKESITLEKLAAAVQKQLPAEHGRSAEMVAGKITISAPAVTATGAIMISTEGTTMTVAPAVVERTAGTGFKVEAAATSTDRINWVVWTE